MVLIALAILFAGLGAASLTRSDTESVPAVATSSKVAPTPTQAMAPAATSAAVAAPAGGTTTTTADSATMTRTVPVRVLNNSTVAGLAAQTAGILEAKGWTVSETGNYSAGRIPGTTVYFGNSDREKQAALEIASELGVTAQPRFAGLDTSSPGVIVIVTAQ